MLIKIKLHASYTSFSNCMRISGLIIFNYEYRKAIFELTRETHRQYVEEIHEPITEEIIR